MVISRMGFKPTFLKPCCFVVKCQLLIQEVSFVPNRISFVKTIKTTEKFNKFVEIIELTKDVRCVPSQLSPCSFILQQYTCQ